MGKICKRCGTSVNENDKFCTGCGAELEKVGMEEASNTYPKTDSTSKKAHSVQPDMDLKEPLTFGNYLLLFLVLAVPVINIVFLLIWAFSKKENINRKNFSKAGLIYVLVTSVLGILFVIWLFFLTIGLFLVEYPDENEYYYHIEEGMPHKEHHNEKEIFPEAKNDRMIAFTSAEKTIGNVEIGKNGIVMV